VILAESYKEMGLPELAEDSVRTLALNYPDHPYLHGGEKKPWWHWLWPWGKEKTPY